MLRDEGSWTNRTFLDPCPAVFAEPLDGPVICCPAHHLHHGFFSPLSGCRCISPGAVTCASTGTGYTSLPCATGIERGARGRLVTCVDARAQKSSEQTGNAVAE